ncbi:hypothetical protein, partial [Propionivibrio sp.]|uniref:hypothetical protein n=1 Tax=Propionivibrio sp. TaxID=2212460 RepID=UPI003BF43A99
MLHHTPSSSSSSDPRRAALHATVLELSRGALLFPVGPTGRLIANFHEQTTYKKIRQGEFPLPCFKIGRHLFYPKFNKRQKTSFLINQLQR